MTKIATRADINFFKNGAFNSELTRCVTLKEVEGLGLMVSSIDGNANKLVKLSDIERRNTIVIVGDEGTVVKLSLLTGRYKAVKLGDISWRSVVSSESGYVIVGYGGYTSFSADGENWSKPKQAGTEAWLGVARTVAGRYVAVGENGNCMYGREDWRSDEGGMYCAGIVWSAPFKVGNVNWYTVTAYARGVNGDIEGFVAAGASGLGMKSLDGKSWTVFAFENAPEQTNTYLCSAADVDRLLVAGTGGVLTYSEDGGATWKTKKYNDDGGALAIIESIVQISGELYLLTLMGNIMKENGNFGTMPLSGPGAFLLSHGGELYALSSHALQRVDVKTYPDYNYTLLVDYAFETPFTSSFRSMAGGVE